MTEVHTGNQGGPEGGAGEGGQGGGAAGSTGTPETVEKTAFDELKTQRDGLKGRLREREGLLEQLTSALGHQPTADDMKALKEQREAAEKAEREKLEQKGEYDKLLERTTQEHETARVKLARERDQAAEALRTEVARRDLGTLLLKKGVEPSAINRAVDALLAGHDGVRIVPELDEASKQHKIKLQTTAGTVAIDPDSSENLTLDRHVDRFKTAEPYFFKPAIGAGAGSGDGNGGTPQSGGAGGDRKAAAEQALTKGTMDDYRRVRAEIFGDDSLAPAK